LIKYYVISLILLTSHALEEYLTNFYSLDWSLNYLSSLIHLTPVIIWLFGQLIGLVLIVVLISKKKVTFLSFILGLILVFEITHILPAINSMSYYPGLLSAIPILIFSYFYWKGLLKTARL